MKVFLRTHLEGGALVIFLIHFSQEGGENIRVSFKVASDKKEKFLLDLDAYFKKYLESNPSGDEAVEQNVHQQPLKFFKDFPNNSIQYNVFEAYECDWDSSYLQQFEDFFRPFSEVYFQISERELSNGESMFEFSVTLLISMMRSYTGDMNDACYSLEAQVFGFITSDLQDDMISVIESYLEKNRTRMLDMFWRIWRHETTSLPYIECWVKCCEQLVYKDVPFKVYCEFVSKVVHQHFGFGVTDWIAPLCLCYKTIRFAANQQFVDNGK